MQDESVIIIPISLTAELMRSKIIPKKSENKKEKKQKKIEKTVTVKP